ncbi:MAG: 16S rRNA (guanine(527)-N(7))-methyltransferase RsmG [Mariprofundaceae bacterium]
MRFSKVLNLTAVKNETAFFERLVAPSQALAAWLPETGRMLDVGSGMGVPGVPLLIAKPGLHGVLVERREKRAEFLRHLVRVLRLDAEVYDADICDLPGLNVDICVARAVTEEAKLLAMCAPHANNNALAVLPVPRVAEPTPAEGWEFVAAHQVQAGEMQLVHCYRFHGWGNKGGFT